MNLDGRFDLMISDIRKAKLTAWLLVRSMSVFANIAADGGRKEACLCPPSM